MNNISPTKYQQNIMSTRAQFHNHVITVEENALVTLTHTSDRLSYEDAASILVINAPYTYNICCVE